MSRIAFVWLRVMGGPMAARLLAGGLAGSSVLDRKAAGMRERGFHPG